MRAFPFKAFAAVLLTAGCSAAPPEFLQYNVEWRLISAGTAKLSWTPSAATQPASASAATGPSEVRLRLESSGLVSRLYKVDDDYRATLGANLCAENSFMTAQEGSRSKETRVTYDSRAGKASWQETDRQKNSTATREVEIPACVHDVMGGLMALRSLHLEPGKTARLPISDGKKTVQARVEAQDRDDIKTPLGKFRAIRYEIFLFNDVLYKRPGHLHIWLTDDDRRLPVQLQVRLQFTIGTITFRLVKEDKNETPPPPH